MTRPLPLPRPLTGDDLLELAARAKATREVTADEAFQLGEGLEIIAADLERERAAHRETQRQLEEARADAARWRRGWSRGERPIAARLMRPAKRDGWDVRSDEEPDTLVVDVPIATGPHAMLRAALEPCEHRTDVPCAGCEMQRRREIAGGAR